MSEDKLVQEYNSIIDPNPKKEGKLKKMNLPNKLTMLRIILVPIFILCLCIPVEFWQFLEENLTFVNAEVASTVMSYLALIIFAVAAFTDFLDGRISRKNGIVTKFGKIMDPLADKLLVSAGFIMLTGLGIVPAFVTAVVVFRDFFVNALRMFGSDNAKDVSAGISGKVKTLFQMLTITFSLLSYAMMPTMGIGSFMKYSLDMNAFELLVNVTMSVTIIFTVVTTIWSFIDYFNRFKEDIDVEN
ncbi:MAG: CDP-diacylglycerol--glycerol-3-phosphate 3-phosphatidyltransferase [Clostridia bacterium]|nr:CDP-diacylglycerol--glycerol-3-phosphate 3-phosphatidyltransferase [Clostridia bacterium]